MKKKGKSGASSTSTVKGSSATKGKRLHELHPRHLKRVINSVKNIGHPHHYVMKKKLVDKSERKSMGFWNYFKKKHSLDFRPLSIKVLIAYIIFLGMFNILNMLSGVKASTIVMMGQAVSGGWAFTAHILMIIILVLVAYGIGRRERWGFNVAILWFAFSMLNSVFSAIFLQSFIFDFVRQMSLISSISVVVINSLVIWYLAMQKRYFFDHLKRKTTLETEDKVFVYTIISFWIITILIGATLGIRFFKATTEQTDKLVAELNGKHLWQAMEMCGSKEGSERDLCYVVVATMQKRSSIISDLQICEKIQSDFFRFTCRRAS